MQEGLAAFAAQAEALNPEQLVSRSIAVAPLGNGALIEGWRRSVGGRELRLPPGPFAVAWQPRGRKRLATIAVAAGDRLGPMPPVSAWLQAQVVLHLLAGLAKAPAAHPHQQVHPGSAATQVVLAAALVAEPGATAVQVVKAIPVAPAAGRAGLVAIAELLSVQSRQRLEDLAPAA